MWTLVWAGLGWAPAPAAAAAGRRMSKVDWLSLVCGLSATGHEASKHDEREGWEHEWACTELVTPGRICASRLGLGCR